jgi:succinate dehydrogenase/fumarate reductase flavoprotein subunit
VTTAAAALPATAIAMTPSTRFDEETDVVVIGTGAAGLTAAIAAAEAGARVIVLEKSGLVGGTTATSGGVIWVPCNRQMRAHGLTDARDEALAYMLRIADGRGTRALTERYLDATLEVVDFLEARTTPTTRSSRAGAPAAARSTTACSTPTSWARGPIACAATRSTARAR